VDKNKFSCSDDDTSASTSGVEDDAATSGAKDNDGVRRSAKTNKEICEESGDDGLKDGNGDSNNKDDKYETDGSYNTEEEEQFIGSLMKKYKLVRSEDAQN